MEGPNEASAVQDKFLNNRRIVPQRIKPFPVYVSNLPAFD